MPARSDDLRALQEFAASLGTRDPKTVTTYLITITVRDFVGPGVAPFSWSERTWKFIHETVVHT